MSDLYTTCMLNYTTSILPHQINNNINKTIESRIKEEMEGTCINDGYVKKGSIKIISRSTGQIIVSQFNGGIIYNVRYSASICNPLEGTILKARVININKMGVLCKGGDDDPEPLVVLMAKQHHINNETFEKLKIDDIIKVKVIGKRYEFGDKEINIVGVLHESSDEETVEESAIKYYSRSKNYKWLSNFNVAEPFEYKDRLYPTVEHAFQAQKSDSDEYKDALTIGTESYIGSDAAKAKSFGTKGNFKKLDLEIIEDWDNKKLELMEEILEAYYSKNEEMKQKLVDTGNSPLLHRGPRIDLFWGINSHGNGENQHGKILMNLREKYREE